MEYDTSLALVTMLVPLLVGIVLLLIGREIVCWYFKIHQVLERMDLINKNLVAIQQAIIEKSPTP